MKKLFFALALTGIIGATSINTVSALAQSKVAVSGGEEEKKKKHKCKKEKACCKAKSSAAAESKAGEKKCCASHAAAQTGSCHSKTPASGTKTSETKPAELKKELPTE